MEVLTMRMIDADALLRALPDDLPYKGSVRRVLMQAETVDAVVHGRWDDLPNEYMSVASKTGAYHGNATTCSVCHDVNPNAFKTNYCPNCGARMDSDSDGQPN